MAIIEYRGSTPLLYEVNQSSFSLLQTPEKKICVRESAIGLYILIPGAARSVTILEENGSSSDQKKKKDETGKKKVRLKIKVFESKTRAPICTFIIYPYSYKLF